MGRPQRRPAPRRLVPVVVVLAGAAVRRAAQAGQAARSCPTATCPAWSARRSSSRCPSRWRRRSAGRASSPAGPTCWRCPATRRAGAAFGHPEWGPFRLGKTNPELSTSGLHALVGANFAATGLSSDLTAANINDPKVRAYVGGIEQAAVHYGPTTLTFLANQAKADRDGRGLAYVSAIAVEEKSLLDYNVGDPSVGGNGKPPQTPLAGIYPREGTVFSDNPYVTPHRGLGRREQAGGSGGLPGVRDVQRRRRSASPTSASAAPRARRARSSRRSTAPSPTSRRSSSIRRPRRCSR